MNELRKTQTVTVFQRAGQARCAKTRSPYLASLITGNIERNPFRVLCELVSPTIVEYSQCDFSNRHLDQIDLSGRVGVDREACMNTRSFPCGTAKIRPAALLRSRSMTASTRAASPTGPR